VASIVGGGHPEADLVVRAAGDHAGERDAAAGVEAEAVHARVAETDLREQPELTARLIFVDRGVTDQVSPGAAVVGHRRSVRAHRAQVRERRRVVPHANRELGVIRRQLRFSTEAKAMPAYVAGPRRAVDERRLTDEQQAVALGEDVRTAVALDGDAVQYRAADHHPLHRLEFEAPAHRRIGEHGRPAFPARREFRSDAEGGVQEEIGSVGAVELAVEIVAPGQDREAIAEEILLEPRLVQRPRARRRDAAHALGVSCKLARLSAVDAAPVEKHRGPRPSHEALQVQRQLKMEVVEIPGASARAPRDVHEGLSLVDQRGPDAMVHERLVQ